MALPINKFWTGKHGVQKFIAVVLIISLFILFIIFVNSETTSTSNDTQKNNINITSETQKDKYEATYNKIITKSNNLPSVTPAEKRPQITKKGCGTGGAPIININQKIINYHDIDTNNNNWAIDTFDQNIKIWKRPENSYTFCAEQNLLGSYNVIAGKTSPGDKAKVLTGNENGVLIGSSRLIIVGLLKPNPAWPTTGNVETGDYQCVFDKNCPTSENHFWTQTYFENIAWGYPKTDWFSWTYRNGDNARINSSDGNYGDVL